MSVKIGKKKSKTGFWVKFHHAFHDEEKEFKEIFIGHRTLASLLTVTVGGIFVGRSLWEISRIHLGLTATIFIGVLLFIYGGLILHNFDN